MDREAVYDRARQLMEKTLSHEGREQGYILHHGLRVAELSLQLADTETENTDQDVLWAAGLFHDVGKGLEPHWYTGRAIVLEHLGALTDNPQQLEMIAHLVRYHAKRSDPSVYSAELRFLQDADILDHRGSMHIWLAVGQGTAGGKSPRQVLEDWHEPRRELRRREFRDMLHYEASRIEYDRRLKQETEFYRALAEACGK